MVDKTKLNAELFKALNRFDKNPILIEELLLQGADVNAKDEDLKVPLIKAAGSRNSYKIIKLLLDNYADINAIDNKGKTALIYAIKAHQSTPERISKRYEKNGDSRSLMSLAQPEGSLDEINLLIENGTDINIKDNEGKTPLIHAIEATRCIAENTSRLSIYDGTVRVNEKMKPEGTINVIKLLLDNGADINIKDKAGMTALDWAKVYKHQGAINLLEKYSSRKIEENKSKTILNPKGFAGIVLLASDLENDTSNLPEEASENKDNLLNEESNASNLNIVKDKKGKPIEVFIIFLAVTIGIIVSILIITETKDKATSNTYRESEYNNNSILGNTDNTAKPKRDFSEFYAEYEKENNVILGEPLKNPQDPLKFINDKNNIPINIEKAGLSERSAEIQNFTSDLPNNIDIQTQRYGGLLAESLRSVFPISSEEASKVQSIAQKYNVNMTEVMNNKQKWEVFGNTEHVIRTILEKDENGKFKNPYTADLLTNPNYMAQAKDNLDELIDLEQAFKNTYKLPKKPYEMELVAQEFAVTLELQRKAEALRRQSGADPKVQEAIKNTVRAKDSFLLSLESALNAEAKLAASKVGNFNKNMILQSLDPGLQSTDLILKLILGNINTNVNTTISKRDEVKESAYKSEDISESENKEVKIGSTTEINSIDKVNENLIDNKLENSSRTKEFFTVENLDKLKSMNGKYDSFYFIGKLKVEKVLNGLYVCTIFEDESFWDFFDVFNLNVPDIQFNIEIGSSIGSIRKGDDLFFSKEYPLEIKSIENIRDSDGNNITKINCYF